MQGWAASPWPEELTDAVDWRRYYSLMLDAMRAEGAPLRPRPLPAREFDKVIANLNA